MPRKKGRIKYGEYCETIDGKLYGSVYVAVGDGKYRRKRKRVESVIEAKQWALGEMARQQGGTIEVDQGTTFAELADWYSREYLIEPVYENGVKVDGVKDWKRLRAKLERMSDDLGPRRLTSITEHDLRSYAKERRTRDKVTTATINRDYALMRAMFRAGQRAAKALTVPRFPINRAAEAERDRIMSFDEERRLLAVCVDKETLSYERKGRFKGKTTTAKDRPAKRAHLGPIIMLAVDTGMRAGEIFKLQWSDIDLHGETITVQWFNAKTEKTRRIGMTPRVKAALSDLWKPDGKVFAGNDCKRAFKTACERAGIEGLHFHDLRHTATTRMIRAGIPHTEVMKITGHTQMKTFLRYLNLSDSTVQNAARQLGEFLDEQPVFESESVN